MLTVVITKKYFNSDYRESEQYINNKDCPLARALKDQHPDFNFIQILSFGVINIPDRNRSTRSIQVVPQTPSYVPVFSSEVASEIFDGKIESVTLNYYI